MVFKRLLGSLGVGGPTVETVLEAGAVLPGGTLRGEVRLVGGSESYDVDRVDLELVAHVEAEHEEGRARATSASSGTRSAGASGWARGVAQRAVLGAGAVGDPVHRAAR